MSFADDYSNKKKATKGGQKPKPKKNLYDEDDENVDEEANIGIATTIDQSSKCASDIVELIQIITAQTGKVKKIGDKIGTDKDTHQVRHELTQTIEETAKHVKRVGALMQSMETFAKNEGEATKQKLKRLKTDLSNSVADFQKVVSTCTQKEKNTAVQEKKQLKQQQQQQPAPKAAAPDDETTSLLQQSQTLVVKKKTKDYAAEIEHNELIISERETDIQEIESAVQDIQGIFRDMHLLAKEQQHGLDLIENSVEDAHTYVQSGVQDIQSANSMDKKSRNWMCILLIVILVAGVGIALLLVVILKFVVRIF